MKKYSKLIILLAVLITALAGTTSVYAKDSSGDYVVIIDPGHGGNDGGAGSVAGDKESDLNWQIARYFKAELETYNNVKVYITRGSNEWNSNTGRGELGVAFGADLAISVHNNSSGPNSRGVLTIGSVNPSYSSATKSLALAISNKVSQTTGLPLAGTNGYMARTGSNGSSDYYTFIDSAVKSGIPAVIIEHCFLSNATDAAFVQNADNQVKLGVADATAVAEYLGLSRRTVATGGTVTLNRSYSVQVKPTNAVSGQIPSYSSSNTNVAYVNSNGLVTAINAGTAVITYKYGNGTSGTCTIKVNPVTLVGIAAGVNPTYYQDSNIDLYSKDRVMVKAIYSDGTVKQLSNNSCSIGDINRNKNGQQSIPVSYAGLTNTFHVYKNAGDSGSYNLYNNTPKGTAYDIFAYPGQVSSNSAPLDYSGAGVSSNMNNVSMVPQTEAPTAAPATEAPATEAPTTEVPTTEAQTTAKETVTDATTTEIVTESVTAPSVNDTSDDSNDSTLKVVGIIVAIIVICGAGAAICVMMKRRNNVEYSDDEDEDEYEYDDDINVDIDDLDDRK